MSRIFEALQNARHDVAKKYQSHDDVPRVTERSRRTNPSAHRDDQRYFALYEKLRALDTGGDGFVLAVMGPNGGEGATTIAREFGDFLARQTDDRILVLECVLESEVRSSGKPDEVPTEYLDNFGATLVSSASQKRTGSLALSAQLPGGTRIRNEAWSRDELNRFITSITPAFSWVVLDCAPVLHPDNAGRLARIADAAVLVIESEVSEVSNVIEASNRLKLLDANLLGVVLNKRSNYVPSLLARVFRKWGNA